VSDTNEHQILPNGWEWISIGETGEYINGFAFKPSHREPGGLPIVRIQNLTDESKPLNTTTIEVPSDYKIDTGDMLMSWSATLDVFVWRRGPALVNQHIFKVVPDVRVMHKNLLFYWLKQAIQQLQKTEHLHGSTMMHINRGPFMAHRVPLPPAAEQTRIVAKLEELLSDLDAGVAELKAAQKKLAQYRQSLLKAAVEGTLTAEWRTKNTPTESGVQLLQRILIDRRARWEAKQLAKFEDQGKNPPKDWQKKYPEPVQPDMTNLLDLPEGWIWVSLDALIGDGPQNGLYLHASKYGRGTPILRIDDYQIGWHRACTELNLVDADNKTTEMYALNVDDLVINRVNSMTHLGKSLCIKEAIAGVLFESNMMRLHLNCGVCADYVTFYLGSELGRERLISDAKWAVNQASINQQDVKKTPIPLPPLSEQQYLTQLLSIQHGGMLQQSTAIDSALKQSAAQRQNILRAAFSGQLVQQDPSDEPASELLSRICAERTERVAVKKPRGRQARAL
jgi:type I restriction enzyme S subunit